MSLFDFLGKMFNFKGSDKKSRAIIAEAHRIETSMVYKKLAVDTCVDLITNAVLACEFITYQNGKEKKGDTYHLLNVRANQNESAAMFKKKLVSRLLRDNECLVVTINDMLYIADSFTRQEFALYDNIYRDVKIGSLDLDQTFAESEVLCFKLNETPVKRVLDSVYEDYRELLTIAKKAYGSKNTHRLIAEGDALWGMTDEAQKTRENFFNKLLRDWLRSDGGVNVLPLQRGITIREWTDRTAVSKQGEAREPRGFIDDIFEFVAGVYHVPISIVRGDKLDVKSEIDSMIMFAVKPPVKVIETEINAKMYTKPEYQARNYVKIDTSGIKLHDITMLSNAADKLFAAGVNSINDNLRLFGKEPIDKSWANRHYITKNYEEARTVENTGD